MLNVQRFLISGLHLTEKKKKNTEWKLIKIYYK